MTLQQTANPEGLLTLDQAASLLGISLRQFRRLVDEGKLAIVRVSPRAPRVTGAEGVGRSLASAVTSLHSEMKWLRTPDGNPKKLEQAIRRNGCFAPPETKISVNRLVLWCKWLRILA